MHLIQTFLCTFLENFRICEKITRKTNVKVTENRKLKIERTDEFLSRNATLISSSFNFSLNKYWKNQRRVTAIWSNDKKKKKKNIKGHELR